MTFKKIFKNKLLLSFLIMAIVIFAILLTVTSSMINFMAIKIEATTEGVKTDNPVARFNFEKLKSIGVIRD